MTPPHPPVLKADGLVFAHAGQPLLFDRLSFELPGGVTWLGGDEGSGKTTLLRLLAGDLPPGAVQGRLDLQGIGLDGPGNYQRQVAWLDPRDDSCNAQTAHDLFDTMAARHAGWNGAALQAHIAGLSLAPHLDKALYMLSSGTRRKVLMAAVLAATAPLTLLDQPFMALDRPSVDYLLALLSEADRQAGRACVVADYEAPPGVALTRTLVLPGRKPFSDKKQLSRFTSMDF